MQSLNQWINNNPIIWLMPYVIATTSVVFILVKVMINRHNDNSAYFKILDHITDEIAIINMINIVLMIVNIKNEFIIGMLLVIDAINIYHMIRYTLIMLSLSPKKMQKDK